MHGGRASTNRIVELSPPNIIPGVVMGSIELFDMVRKYSPVHLTTTGKPPEERYMRYVRPWAARFTG